MRANRRDRLILAASLLWVFAFLMAFFGEVLPNASEGITRPDIWRILFINFATLLNPLDYSSNGMEGSGWHTLPQRLPFFVVAVGLWSTSWILGRSIIVRGPATSSLRRSELLVMEFGVGLSLLTLWVFLCGVCGYLTLGVILLPIISGLSLLKRRNLSARSTIIAAIPSAANADAKDKTGRYLLLLAVPFAVHIFLGGFTPPFDFDVREYHLQGPKEWFQAGRISHLDHNVYTSFPFLSEMLSLAAMVLHNDWWAGAISGKFTLVSFQLLSTLSAYAIAARWFGKMPGIIAALAVISTPWTTRISIIAYAEGAASFYLIASVMTALLAKSAVDKSAQRSLWTITGFFAGSAMAAKYPGVLSAVIPCGMLLLIAGRKKHVEPARSRHRQRSINAAVFTIAVCIAVGPWLMKNLIVTGNPVYPLAYSVFGGDHWNPEMDLKWKQAHSASDHDLARLPAHLWDLMAKNDWQSGLLFALAIPSLALLKRFEPLRWLWLHTLWIVATWWAFTHRIDRFWVPIIPLLAVLAGAAWRLSDTLLWRSTVRIAIVICCTYNFGFCRLPLIGFHAGLADMQSIQQHPMRTDIKFLNQSLPNNAKLLLVGEAEVFDMDFPLIYNTVFDDCIFEQWTSAVGQGTDDRSQHIMKSAKQIQQIFRDQHITHIYINWSEILRYRLTYGYTKYVVPNRFIQLQNAGLLSAPTAMSTGDWDALSEQQQAEISSWSGGESLRVGDQAWANIQLYQVLSESR